MDDGELIRRYCEGGDEAAFAALVRLHRGFIRRTLFAVFGGWDDEAEEAEQEVLIALTEALPRFRGDSGFTTWLYRLTRNRGLDRLRSIRRRRRREIRGVPENLPAADTGVLTADERGFLYAVLGRLREEERSLLQLKELDGFSLAECAELLGIPEGTAKSRLHRARARAARLAARLAGEEES